MSLEAAPRATARRRLQPLVRQRHCLPSTSKDIIKLACCLTVEVYNRLHERSQCGSIQDRGRKREIRRHLGPQRCPKRQLGQRRTRALPGT